MKKVYLLPLFLLVSLQIFSQNYTVLGNATQLASCNSFELTPDVADHAGAIFQNQTINLNNSFDFTFSNFFGCNGSSGADGVVFVLTTNPNGLGGQGGGLGYSGSNQPCSFAVEFDTWENGNVGDPSYDHVAFESGGNVTHNVSGPVAALPNQGDIDDCQWHTVQIVWDVNTNTMSVYVDGSRRLNQVFPNLINTYLCGNPNVNWGWTGSTGRGHNLQQVKILRTSSWVAGVNYQSCSPTIQFQDISTSNIGALNSWQWTFGDGGTSTAQNPTHTYPSAGPYNVTLIVTDATGCADTFSHVVTIAAPLTLASTINDPPCNGGLNGSIALTPSGGFGVTAGYGGFMYNWSNGRTTQTNAGVGAGTYTVTVTDGVCTATGQYTVGQPTALSASTSSTAADCGQANGTCTIVISGGTPPYTGVSFAGVAATGGPSSYTTSGFIGGTYIADFHDANGCSALLQYTSTVTTNPCGISSTTSQTNVTCYGNNTGSATLNVSGSAVSPPSTISWTLNGNPVGTGATISSLAAGTYNYTYTDQNGANTFTGTINITQPGAPFTAGLVTSNVSCSGLTDGQAIASVTSGGVAPFHYAWSGGQPDNPVANNLGQGAVSVTVTDASGCTATASGTISSAPPLALNIATTNNACSQANNGSATANVTGGAAPYQYSWSNIASGQTNLNLSAGSYTVTVTDSLGCTITGSTSITGSTPLVNNVNPTNVNCYGDSTGAIAVNTSGGATPYTYNWSSDSSGVTNPNLTGASINTLPAGDYYLTVTDGGGCIFSDTITIQQPASALSLTETHTNVTCYGSNNGTLTLTLGGGTAPYDFNGQTIPIGGTFTQSNLAPGVYAGTVTDANSCTVSQSVTITEPPADSLVITHVDVTCFGGTNGSATANFVNPNGAVNYQWSNSQTGATATGLVTGNYDVTATDANSCVLTGSVFIDQPTAISVQSTQTDVLCYGDATGDITLTVSGGTGPNYTYTWNPNVSTTNTANGLTAGTYAITITDQNSCTKDTTVTITQPAQAVSATYTIVDVACYGDATGSVDVTTSGGVSPYSYTWNPNVGSTNIANNLTAGSYDLTITDQNGCTITSTQIVAQPASALTVGAQQNDVTCFGGNDGIATVYPGGGTTPYTYAWTGSASTTDVANNLTAGNYSVTVTDAHNCTITQSYVIAQPTDIDIQSTQTDVLCYGDATGDITLTVSGGIGPNYTYTWNPNVSTTNTASGLTAGSYNITVTDQSNCTKTTTINITQPAQALAATYQITDVACYGGATGSIAVTASGGVSPYTFAWNPNVSSTSTASGLTAGNYDVTVTDQNGCTLTSTQAVAEPAAALALDSSHTDVHCYGGNDGTATVVPTGGTSPYTYVWTGSSSTSATATGLAFGTYSVLVTDNHNCTATQAYAIDQPTQISMVSTNPVNPLCNTSADGTITYTTSGGTSPYAYSWNPGVSTTNTATGIVAGTYVTTVTDAQGCTVSQTTTLTAPSAITVTTDSTPASCNGVADGSLTIAPTGGTPNYSYGISDGTNSQNNTTGHFTGLAATIYSITVTDQNGCTVTSQGVVTQPNAMADNVSSTAPTCSGNADGTVQVLANGGNGGYNYSLTGQSTNTTGMFSGLAAGTYYINITDANSCMFADSVTLTEPDPLVLSPDVQNPTCAELPANGSIAITVTGGTAPYNYQWSNGGSSVPLQQDLQPGNYHLTVTDDGGCLAQDSFNLDYQYAFTVTGLPLDSILMGNSDTLGYIVSGTAGNYTAEWADDSTLDCTMCDNPVAIPYLTTIYSVTITNDSGCTASAFDTVVVTPYYNLYIPNAFTPNGDGRNDYFSVYGNLNVVQRFEVKIFNRWGMQVFESTDPNFKWDGTYKGEQAQADTYVYTITMNYLDGYAPYLKKGSLALIR